MAGQAIVSYNVENLFDTKDDPATNDADFLPESERAWTPERYRTKLQRLAEAITWSAEGTPALVGLVEVENGQVVRDLAETGALKDGDYQVVHHDSPDERGIDVALLVHPRFAKVVKEQALTVPLPNDHTRDVLYAELTIANSERLHVFMNHWPSRRDGEASVPKRMAAAAVVRAQVDLILAEDPKAQVLIMGDLNDAPRDASIQQGLGAACDANAEANLFDLMCMGQPEGHGSYNYRGEWDYLDQMIVSRTLLARAASAKAYWDDRLLFKHPRYGPSPDKTYAGSDYKGGYSDHLPIVLRLN
jgi:endonuclease/exonuclease/phosphatase family metal-dependent hydrolase